MRGVTCTRGWRGGMVKRNTNQNQRDCRANLLGQKQKRRRKEEVDQAGQR
jgi:hypothetical protein